jgi:hypothetical protein
MAHPEKVRARIQFVDQALARLRAERGRLVARATVAARKRDTRRKILVGSAVLAAVAHEGVPALGSAEALMAWLEPRLTRPPDRAAFDLER